MLIDMNKLFIEFLVYALGIAASTARVFHVPIPGKITLGYRSEYSFECLQLRLN